MRNLLLILLVFGMFLSVGATAQAEKSDPFVPIVESDDFVPVPPSGCNSLDCMSQGKCETYCEDLNCDTKEGFYSNPDLCTKLLEKYQKKTGYPGPPCVCEDVCVEEQLECKSECNPKDLECLSDCCSDYHDCRDDCCDQDGVTACIPTFCAVAP